MADTILLPISAEARKRLPLPTGDYDADETAIVEALTPDMAPTAPDGYVMVEWQVAPPDDVQVLFERRRPTTKIHTLKTWPEFFEDIIAGRKTFELRNNDRGFKVGDTLELREYDPKADTYSGRMVFRSVKHILEHQPEAGCAATFGLQPGYVIMSLGECR